MRMFATRSSIRANSDESQSIRGAHGTHVAFAIRVVFSKPSAGYNVYIFSRGDSRVELEFRSFRFPFDDERSRVGFRRLRGGSTSHSEMSPRKSSGTLRVCTTPAHQIRMWLWCRRRATASVSRTCSTIVQGAAANSASISACSSFKDAAQGSTWRCSAISTRTSFRKTSRRRTPFSCVVARS